MDEKDRFTLHFSNERTCLAWIRTSSALMGFGYAVAKFAMYLEEHENAKSATTYLGGLMMAAVGLIALVMASVRYHVNGVAIDGGGLRKRSAGVYMFAILVGLTGSLLLILLFVRA